MYVNKKERWAIDVAITTMDKVLDNGYQDEDIYEACDILCEFQEKIRKEERRKHI